MVHAIFYIFGEHGYCDPLLHGEIKLIPSPGDMYLFDASLVFGLGFVEIDQIVYISDEIVHIYCSNIEPDFLANPPYYGTRNNKGSLVAHSFDQISNFPARYGIKKPKGFLDDMIAEGIKEQKRQNEKGDTND